MKKLLGFLLVVVSACGDNGAPTYTEAGPIVATTRGAKEKAVSQYIDLKVAVEAMSAGETLLIDAATAVPVSITVPENILLQWVGCHAVTVADGQTLTVLSPVSQWPTCQIFALQGSGALSFNQNRYLQDLQLEWVGGKADDATDNAPALNRIVGACAKGNIQGCPIRVFNGVYKFTTNPAPITVPVVSIKGVGGLLFNGTSQATTFKCAALSGICFDFASMIHNSAPIIEDINFTDSNPNVLTLVRLVMANRTTMNRVSFTDAAIGLQVFSNAAGGAPCAGIVPGGDSSWHLFTQLVFYNNTIGFDALSGAGSVVMGGDFFSTGTQVGMRVHECTQGMRVIGAKFDGGLPALWVEGGSGNYIGINCEAAAQCLKVGNAATTYVQNAAAWRNQFIGNSFQGQGGTTVGVLLDTNARRTTFIGSLSTWGTSIKDVSLSADTTLITDFEGIRTDYPIRGQVYASGVNTQTGATYAFKSVDENKLTVFNRSTPIAATLSAASASGFTNGAVFSIMNIGMGTVTITPTTSTINDASTLVLTTGQGAQVISNGTHYYYWR